MISFRYFLLSLALAAGAKSAIQWAPCDSKEFNTTEIQFQCAGLDVPLDYTDKNSDKKLTLQLLKVPAVSKSKGSILFNTGGPGLSARDDVSALGSTLLPLTGGQYDHIGMDPRGVGKNFRFNCSDDPSVRAVMKTEQICKQYPNSIGSLIGTAFVARDLMSVVDALEEDGKLRYWGLSYGTTLGATVASMFPNRMDKIILDGVQNPNEYYRGPANIEEWTDSDKVFSRIFAACVAAGPEKCWLASHHKTAEELEDAAWNLLDKLKERPLAMNTTILDYTALKGQMARPLYSIRNWPGLTSILDVLLYGTEEQLAKIASALASSPAVSEADTVIPSTGIHYGDNSVRVSNLDDALPTVKKLYKTSRLMGGLEVGGAFRCNHWNFTAKEIYKGKFEAKLPNPMLIIGNTYDGHTPIKSAREVSKGYNSVLLEINGYGHASTSVPSKCTLEKVSAYWVNGTLPEPGTVCEVDAKRYSGMWWPDIFKMARVGGSYL